MFFRLLSYIGITYVLGYDICTNNPNNGTWATGCTQINCTTNLFPLSLHTLSGTSVVSYVPNTNYSIVLGNKNGAGPCTPLTCFKEFIMVVGLGNIIGPLSSVSSASRDAGIIHLDTTNINTRMMQSCYNGITQINNTDVHFHNAIWSAASSNSVTFKAILINAVNGNNYVSTLSVPIDTSTYSSTYSSTESITHTSTESITHSITHTSTESITHSVTPTIESHTATESITHSVTPSITHTSTESITHSVTPSITHTATESITHSVTPTIESHSPSHSRSKLNIMNATEASIASTSSNSEVIILSVFVGVFGVLAIIVSSAFIFKKKKSAVSSSKILMPVADFVTNNSVEFTPVRISRLSVVNKMMKDSPIVA